jgi:Flp pilus assembly protein protease CpaA
MYMIFYSSIIGGVCLLIALILRNRSYKQGAERMRTTIIRSFPNASPEEVEKICQVAVTEENDK